MSQECHRHPLTLAVLLLATAAPAAAQTPAAATRSVAGLVVEADGQTPLRRAQVVLSAGSSRVATTATNDHGEFIVRDAPRAAATIRVIKAGYASATVTIPPVDDATPLRVSLTRGAAVEGRVRNEFGAPLPQVRVSARRIGSSPEGAPIDQTFTATTDPLGEYRLNNLPPGAYEIAARENAATAAGAGSGGQRLVPPSDPVSEPQRLMLAAGDERLLDHLLPGVPRSCRSTIATSAATGQSSVTGRVTNLAGEPLACVRVLAARAADGRTPAPGAYTDAQGVYAIDGLAAGPVMLTVIATGYERLSHGQATLADERQPITLRSGERREGADVVVPRLPVVSGTVVDEHGEPLQNVRMSASQMVWIDGQLSLGAPVVLGENQFTDDRGRYRLLVPERGHHLIIADGSHAFPAPDIDRRSSVYLPTYYPGTTDAANAWRVDMTETRDVPGVDIMLGHSEGAVVSGIATDAAGVPLSGTVVLATSARSGAVRSVLRRAPLEREGRFTIRDVPPGDYVLKAEQTVSGGRRHFGMQYVTVTAGSDPAPVRIRTVAGATITGTVVIDGAPAADDEGITVSAHAADPDRTAAAVLSPSMMPASVLEEGRFRLEDVTSPSRLTVAAPRCENCYVKWALVGGADAADRGFDFTAGDGPYRDVQIVVARDGGVLEGVVRDERGAAVTSPFQLVVFSTNRELWYPRSPHVKATFVSGDSSFRVPALPPGDYYVAAVDQRLIVHEGYGLQEPVRLERLSAQAQRVTIAAHERRTVTVGLLRK